MKLRVRGDSLRLRVTQSEVAELIEGRAVEEVTHIGPAQFRYVLQPSSAPAGEAVQVSLKTEAAVGEINVAVPALKLRDWGQSSEVGIDVQVDALAVLIEKDFACLDPRDGAEDSDTFPNPKAAS